MQGHIKAMTEVFDALAFVGDPVSEEDRVVHLLASLPDSFDTLVTALETNETVPKMETVTERLLHEERKLKDKREKEGGRTKALASQTQFSQKPFNCHYCGKPGHFKRNCHKLTLDKEKIGRLDAKKEEKHKANKVTLEQGSSEDDALIVTHALLTSSESKNNWIVDSGATCLMCNDQQLFKQFVSLKKPQAVTLGDGHTLEVVGQGIVTLEARLPSGKIKRCNLNNVLCVPKLAYNLLSVTKASEAGKTVCFNKNVCTILNKKGKALAIAAKLGSLYYLNCKQSQNQLMNVSIDKRESKETLWHRRYGHLGENGLRKLAKKGLVDSFNYDASEEISFCETYIGGKHHKSPMPSSSGNRLKELLGLVHSDICGKISTKSIGGAEYFLTFIDDKTCYVWVYTLKHKAKVFDRFVEWKALVEKQSGKKLKVLRTDNGREYTSNKFEEFLKIEGVLHEHTVPKTPEQNSA